MPLVPLPLAELPPALEPVVAGELDEAVAVLLLVPQADSASALAMPRPAIPHA